MTGTLSQLPGELNLEMVDDNDLVFIINWNTDLTDYSFEANIVPKACEDEIEMIVTPIDLAVGTISVAITAESIADLSPSTNRWYLNWEINGYIRTVIAGSLVIRSR